MDELGNRIRTARNLRKWSQATLATECGWESSSRVGNYEQSTREPMLADIRAMARALHVREAWLSSGEEPMLPITGTGALDAQPSGVDSNVSPGPAIRGRVPVIHGIRAGDFGEIVDIYQTGEADEWLDVTCPVNRHTFALVVEGDSMEPEFREGMRIVVEPDLKPENGDYVVAGNGDSANLKKLVRVGEDWYLKPLNDAYKTKPLGDTPIVGVVREAHKKYR